MTQHIVSGEAQTSDRSVSSQELNHCVIVLFQNDRITLNKQVKLCTSEPLQNVATATNLMKTMVEQESNQMHNEAAAVF